MIYINIFKQAGMKMPVKIYRAVKDFAYYHLVIFAEYCKYNKEIKNRLKRTPQPELTSKEKKEIDSFWKQYGIKFKNYDYFRWYYGFTGIKSPKFVPIYVHLRILLSYHNKHRSDAYYRAYSDKNLFYDFLPGAPFPKPILKNIEGTFFASSVNAVSNEDRLIELLIAEPGDVIVKKAVGSSQGRSVKRYSVKSKEDAKALLDDWKNESDYIIQEAIKQHPFFSRFNESSVNVIRVNSFCINGKADITTAVLRFGYPGWVTDISFIDGKEDVRGIKITEDGCLSGDVVSMQGKKCKLSDVVEDPENKKVPSWDEIVSLVEENAPKLKHIGIIGWDITVKEDGKPVILEYNLGRPGSSFNQMAAGPWYGKQTEAALEFLKTEENQKKYVRRWLKA